MVGNNIESGADSSRANKLDSADSPAKKEIKGDSFLLACRRLCGPPFLILWLIILFVYSTFSAVGCLSAHVLQSQFEQVLENRTVKEEKHIYWQYLQLRKVIPPQNSEQKPTLQELLKELKGKEYGPELLYLARSESSLKKICIPGYCLSDFSEIPRQLLVLFLTISMGVLGSLMRITRNYFATKSEEEEEDITWYIFRPFLGAITALSVLILLKAGQLTITNASVGNDTQGLNPFFISFIAMISGFLSVQAHDRIRRAGAAIFGTLKPPTVSRWLVTSHLNIHGEKDLASLASYLSTTEEEVQKWFDMKEAVPESAQPIVAAWLHQPQRVLFTDLKPDKKVDSKDDMETAATKPTIET